MTLDDLICPQCGYDLRGIDSSNCPECGQELDRKQLSRSRIPWSYRDEIGIARAYWRTVWMVLRRPSEVAADVVRPVSLHDAQKFRRHTVAIAAIVPIALLLLLGVYVTNVMSGAPFVGAIFATRPPDPNAPLPPMYTFGWMLEYALILVTCLSAWLYLLCIAGVASYFFHPASIPIVRQNRAVALSYYACAPLALTPITFSLAAVLAWWFREGHFFRKGMAFPISLIGALALATICYQLIALVMAPIVMLARSTHCTSARLWALGLALPILWTLLGAIILMGIPGSFAFISLVVLSLAG